ncbi:MAG: hypothetical protein DMF07_08520 [Verrucomicrobia bacterium]|nr:MAG: hypothetical protein DMF07_08520 [Verrucomicrobiota bacterium]
MKALSGTFALKFGILGASVAASIILISACEKSVPPPSGNRPILVIFKQPGVPTKAESEKVKKAFEDLGEDFCNVDYYGNNIVQWHVGHLSLKMTSAVRSEAAASSESADPTHLLQKVAFTDLDQAQQTFSTINSTATPTPTPTSP